MLPNVYFVLEMAEKAQFPGCLMNVGKMADGRWLRADVIPLRLASYIDVPRSLPILRSHYREKHVAYRSDTHYGVGDLSNRVIHELPLELYKTYF